MAERMVLGVDFSGGGKDKDTWATRACLGTEKQSLILLSCKPITRKNLTEELKELPNDAVAALDFPFSVPIDFAEYLECPGCDMPALWSTVATLGREEFIGKRDKFVEKFGQLLRAGDTHVPKCFSCLQKFPINMVPMTFHGMEMLNCLRMSGSRVPPLDNDGCNGATMLEVMPGAALEAFGLPNKGYKEGLCAFENRREILKELPKISNVTILNLPDFRDHCMFSDHALDSIVATVVAALCVLLNLLGSGRDVCSQGGVHIHKRTTSQLLRGSRLVRVCKLPSKFNRTALWVLDKDETQIKRPTDDKISEYNGKRSISPGIVGKTEIEAAKLEGWIYVPYPRK